MQSIYQLTHRADGLLVHKLLHDNQRIDHVGRGIQHGGWEHGIGSPLCKACGVLDAVVEKENFLRTYADALKKKKVICGGLYHANILPSKECTLRYRYEKKADRTRDAKTRSKAPYDRFTSFNFAISKDLFSSILFDTSITRYGYEDVLFGKELEKKGIEILHIENRLLHSGLEENAVFLSKTEQALRTLATIEKKVGSTPLLGTVSKLERYRLTGLFMRYWRHNRERLKNNLLGPSPSLFKFKIYKLGYYISLSRQWLPAVFSIYQAF